MRNQVNRGWELPHLKEVRKIPGVKTPENEGDLYSVKFYPYNEVGHNPVFAVVGGKFILIGRLRDENEGDVVEWIQFIVNESDDDIEEDHYACTWSKDPDSSTPWLCVGGKYGKIQVINALTGELIKTLIGHGGPIEDLSTSPTNPQIIASASEDSSIRLWSLSPAHSRQPCAAILSGEGHRSEILTIAFHSTGRYLLSGGIDRNINLWTLPSFPDENTGTDKPTLIHYPHFSTSDVSWHHIDCVAFYGDLVLCKSDDSAEITLFAITNFSSSSPTPSPESAPTAHDTSKTTRSAFVKLPMPTSTKSTDPNSVSSATSTQNHPPQLYTRLLTFHIPDSEVMFTRFSLSPTTPTSPSPILAYCNSASKVFFWDLDRLTSYYDWSASSPWELSSQQDEQRAEDEPLRPRFLVPFQRRVRGGGLLGRVQRERERSPADSVHSHSSTNSGSHASTPLPASESSNSSLHKSSATHPSNGSGRDPVTGRAKVDWNKTRELWSDKYEMRDAFKGIEAHREEVIRAWAFTGRQVAWSPDAEWCVVVGSGGVVALFQKKSGGGVV